MKKGLVSVIIPTYGGAEFLTRCVDSVFNQTYQEIEVIVVDDNGVGTPKQVETSLVINKYKDQNNIKYVCHNVNINGSAARNTGFKHSNGEFIALLDDDDVFLKNKIERQVNLLSSLPMEYGAVYCSHETFLSGKKVGEQHAIHSGRILYEYMSHMFEICSSSILLRRSVWEELNGFDESFKRHQDWEFVSRILYRYAIKSDDFYGFERILQFRNSRVSPNVYKERRLFYLEKMSPIIKSFTKEQQDNLIVNERIDVASVFLKSNNYLGFINELVSIKPRVLAIKLFCRKLLFFLKRGCKIID